jgi:hypothetical protein
MPPAGICAGGYERSQFLLRLAILSEGVHRFEGTVNQYIGDGIMALFGTPIAHEDHAPRACYAVLHLQRELRSYAGPAKKSLISVGPVQFRLIGPSRSTLKLPTPAERDQFFHTDESQAFRLLRTTRRRVDPRRRRSSRFPR